MKSVDKLTPWITALSLFLLFYLPWLIGDSKFVIGHDVLDGTIPIYKLIGEILKGGDREHIFLNGALPYWAIPGLLNPLVFIYSITNAWSAFVTIDIIVRVTAFTGMYLLAKNIFAFRPILIVLISACFATCISNSIFLLSIGGMPLILWTFIKLSKENSRKIWKSFLILINLAVGFNCPISLGGLFFLMACYPLTTGILGIKFNKAIFIAMSTFLVGMLIGSANIIYAQFISDIAWHRLHYRPDSIEMHGLLTQIYNGLKSTLFFVYWDNGATPVNNEWYHVNVEIKTIFFLLIAATVINLRNNSRKVYILLISIFCIIFIYSISKVPALSEYFPLNISILKSFQWNRFYFLYPLLIFLLWIYLYTSTPYKFLRIFLIFILTTQIILNYIQYPQINSLILNEKLKSSILARLNKFSLVNNTLKVWVPTDFDIYYSSIDYKEIKEKVKNKPILSIGLDPMKAAMNNINTIDGYYSMYPLEYKLKFREVIEDSLLLSGAKNYFDNWGNRIYIFYPLKHIELVNFCKAYELGARFAIAGNEIPIKILSLEIKTSGKNPIWLYRIEQSQCPTHKQ